MLICEQNCTEFASAKIGQYVSGGSKPITCQKAERERESERELDSEKETDGKT
jgi:hypothetical protein